MAQLIGTLLKIIVTDWRKYNLFFISLPSVGILLVAWFVVRESPKDLLLNLAEIDRSIRYEKILQ